MKTTNAMQLKARIKARAKKAGVSPQLLMQDYMLERLLERISRSQWQDKVIVKGGMLIASFIGIDNRVTKDLDTTVRGFALSHESAESVFRDVAAIELDDDVTFEFVRTEEIREGDEYPGIRVFLKTSYAPMTVSLTVDVTTGDAITPGAVRYNYPLTFEGYTVPLMTYPLETVLAEKLETVLSRGRGNTRPRDYYDIHMLWSTRGDEVDPSILKAALTATAAKRDAVAVMGEYRHTMDVVAHDQGMLGLWKRYTRDYSYAGGLELPDACATVCKIMEAIGW